MFPISINGKEYTKKDIVEKEILKICKKHHSEGKAKIFSILLFDVNDGNLCKIINDKQYWESLNAISGNGMTVIYLPTWYEHANRNKYNNEIEKIFSIENRFGKSLIILFQVDQNNNILEDYRYFIKSKKMEDIYLEIKGLFETISEAFNYITKENEQNYPELFDLAKTNATTYNIKGLLKKIYTVPLTILDVLSGVKSFI